MRSQDELKVYETGRPINAAALSPVMDHIILGGGERAEDVTQSGPLPPSSLSPAHFLRHD